MASTVQVPPPRPRRSFAGPVVLIVLGAVFLLGNLGYVGWGRLAHLFAHYWPVLLILWGVIKLVEYQQAQKQGYQASGIGVGGVFLLVLLITIGLAATHASRYHWEELRDQITSATRTSTCSGIITLTTISFPPTSLLAAACTRPAPAAPST